MPKEDKKKHRFKKEFKRQVRLAIAAAIGFTIAFTWRSFIYDSTKAWIERITPLSGVFESGIATSLLVTVIGVALIIISSKLLSK